MKNKLIAIVDTREKIPLDLQKFGISTVTKTLQHGDYSLLSPHCVESLCIERKTIPDLVNCCGKERDRFTKEMRAMRGYSWRFVIVEGRLSDIQKGVYRSKTNPESVMGSIASFFANGISFLFAENQELAARIVAGVMKKKAEQIFRYALQAMEGRNGK